MLLRSSLFVICAWLLVAAKGNTDDNQLTLDQEVIATFDFHGTPRRIWSELVNPKYLNSSLEDRKYFYDPVLVPVLNRANQTSFGLYTDSSTDSSNRGKVRVIIDTNDRAVRELAYNAVKMASKKGIEIKLKNVQPLPIIELNLTLSNSYTDPSNSGTQCCFRMTFENPGPTVELFIMTDSEEKAKHIAGLLDNDNILYSMDVETDIMIKRQTFTCKNGQVTSFGLLKGKINLREYKLMQHAHLQSQQILSLNQQLQKRIEIMGETLANALKENSDQKEEFQTKIQQMQEKMLSLEERMKTMKSCPSCWTGMWKLDICYCYRVFAKKLNLQEAVQSCRASGSELAAIHSQQENSFIREQANTVTPGNIWIGLKYGNWIDGTPKDFCLVFLIKYLCLIQLVLKCGQTASGIPISVTTLNHMYANTDFKDLDCSDKFLSIVR